ncbi:sucrase/ferredoxin domain-containing protein [Coccidioides immitis RS]|uniref:Sucrase/ferredoxin domain-containing protein n=1 Tax=Coccidioides immitis (strain RS) TaxID=246410 RepID=A0A0D8JV37_COCIM|nr:sucrase/ferredoxin domain-containing protein [Coccidioides immitis RS]KJF61185.1 sucrase/ferredoxin domain-containing protein [Coccidioides immitis RS]
MFNSLVSRARSVWGTKGNDGYIFPTVDPESDGPDCTRDCADCTIKYPSRFMTENQRRLYGKVKPFATHVLVATGKSDWVPKVENMQGTLMEAFASTSRQTEQGVPHYGLCIEYTNFTSLHRCCIPKFQDESTILLLPSFTFVDRVRVGDIPELKSRFIEALAVDERNDADTGRRLTPRSCQRDYVVLLCSHKSRDARCGISAPLIKRELERHLRPLGLHRDDSDDRPGGVSVYFVSHVGGHKFSANVLIYRKEAEQMIWLARVRPEHCEGIVKYTILKGKVVHPDFQLRGGFDNKRCLTSW